MAKVIEENRSNIFASNNADRSKTCLKPENNICHNPFARKLDYMTFDVLGLEKGQTLTDSQEKLHSECHRNLCSSCIWRKTNLTDEKI